MLIVLTSHSCCPEGKAFSFRLLRDFGRSSASGSAARASLQGVSCFKVFFQSQLTISDIARKAFLHSVLARIALPSGKAPCRVIFIGSPGDRYTDRPLPGGTVEIDRRRSISIIGGQLREKEEEGGEGEKEGETCFVARCSSLVPPHDPLPAIDSSPVGDSFSPCDTGKRTACNRAVPSKSASPHAGTGQRDDALSPRTGMRCRLVFQQENEATPRLLMGEQGVASPSRAGMRRRLVSRGNEASFSHEVRSSFIDDRVSLAFAAIRCRCPMPVVVRDTIPLSLLLSAISAVAATVRDSVASAAVCCLRLSFSSRLLTVDFSP
ncbi:hypothetical protein GW17_00029551 [Ensete ventricosum]|nr:hypothetical protein GW17_00029551 [Ensete ventricosum]